MVGVVLHLTRRYVPGGNLEQHINLALISDNTTDQGRNAVMYLLSEISRHDTEVSVAYFASQPDPDRVFFEQIKQFYKSFGVHIVHYIELEDNYDDSFVREALSSSVIHLSGGDTYRFLFWLKRRGLDVAIRHCAKEGKPIVGVSAGAMILTPTIDSAPLCGDINAVGLSDTSALNIAPFMFSPHAQKTSHEMTKASNLVSNKAKKLALCSDSDAIVVTKGKTIEFGSPLWF